MLETPALAFMVSWFLVMVALFGLARLFVSRRGLAEEWAALVAFGGRVPSAMSDAPIPEHLLESAPPGLWPGEPAARGRLRPTLGGLYQRMREHQAMLQTEMKWYARRSTSPLAWFRAGLRGLVLLSRGLAFDVDLTVRARRRALEQHPDFQRIVDALQGVVLFVLLGVLFLVVRDEGPVLARYVKG